jgi:thymidine kinase
MAKLYFRYGTMNSGKSTQLIAFAHNLKSQGIRYLAMKSAIDTREGEPVIFSRPIGKIPCEFIEPDDTVIFDPDALDGAPIQWLLVDEAQFLTAEQVDRLAEIVDLHDINVICFGLRNDFRTKLFEGSKRLFEIADSIAEIKSICKCGRKNIINARIDKNGKAILTGPKLLVGAEDIYAAKCRKCYYEDLGKYPKQEK